MHIVHVIGCLDPSRGGPPVVALGLAAAQASLGHRVTMIFQSDPATRDEEQKLLDAISDSQLVHLVRIADNGRTADRPSLTDALGDVADADVLHLQGVWCSIIRRTAGWAIDRHVPYVISPHGALGTWCLAHKRWRKMLALRFVYRRLLRQARFLLINKPSEESMLAALDLGVPVETVPLGISPDAIELDTSRDELLGIVPAVGERPYILFLGRLALEKGPDVLIEAFAHLRASYPHVDLVVTGPDGGEGTKLRGQVERLGLAEHVHFTGPRHGREKSALYQHATCVAIPSRYESFGMVIVEAMLAGKPVVISNDCEFPQVTEVDAGKSVPLDPRRMAAALAEVLDDGPWRERAGQSARQLVLEKYTWPAVAEQTVERYRQYLHQPQGAAT